MFKKFLILYCGVLSFAGHAEEVHVGTVFHSLAPLNEIIHLFEKNSSAKIIAHEDSFTTTVLYKQIKEKNDLDIVLLGDVKTAVQLEKEGLANKDARFTYAFGKLVLWSKNPDLVDAKGEVLISGEFRNIASLDPNVAPYGFAAQQVLEKLKRREALQSKWIFVANSGEMQKQVMEGKIDLAFIPLATLNPSKKIEGSLWIIPKSYYHVIEQQAVLLKKSENNQAAKAFFEYLRSPQARNIFEKYGFSLP